MRYALGLANATPGIPKIPGRSVESKLDELNDPVWIFHRAMVNLLLTGKVLFANYRNKDETIHNYTFVFKCNSISSLMKIVHESAFPGLASLTVSKNHYYTVEYPKSKDILLLSPPDIPLEKLVSTDGEWDCKSVHSLTEHASSCFKQNKYLDVTAVTDTGSGCYPVAHAYCKHVFVIARYNIVSHSLVALVRAFYLGGPGCIDYMKYEGLFHYLRAKITMGLPLYEKLLVEVAASLGVKPVVPTNYTF
jgi:hypothetical protein